MFLIKIILFVSKPRPRLEHSTLRHYHLHQVFFPHQTLLGQFIWLDRVESLYEQRFIHSDEMTSLAATTID